MKIQILRHTETVDYAVQELFKYLRTMTGGRLPVTLEVVEGFSFSEQEPTIALGLLEELACDASDVEDPVLDDVIDVDVKNGVGYIAGSNERSILMGIYRYCYSLGCRYVRPGIDGDYIPVADPLSHAFRYRKKADQRFRGECSEGAIGYEHMRDTVYWLPKIGMNLYMIEGLVPYTYMHKWYGHEGNPLMRVNRQVTDYAMLQEHIARLEKDIKRVGLQLHSMGHGWMFEKMGMKHSTPDAEKAVIARMTPEQKSLLAEVNGQRDLYHDSTFYTHMCYSNPQARRQLVDFCVEYARQKPYIDFLHIWLADGINNQCECESCVKMTPADHYVILLNEIDAALTAIGSKTRLVFIMYVDTVRPPEKMRLVHPERFTLLAAIGSDYENGYETAEYVGELPPFERNRFVPASKELRMHYFKTWKRLCNDIDSFVFEYRFYIDHYCDPGYMKISREVDRDMRTLDRVSLQGAISDQTPRSFLPTSLPLSLMGEILFDRSLVYEDYVNAHFAGAFGADGDRVRAYLESLTEHFCTRNLRIGGKGDVEEDGIENKKKKARGFYNNPEVAQSLEQIPAILDAFLPLIKQHMAEETAVWRQSWVYLLYHSKICRLYADYLLAGARGQREEAEQKLERMECEVAAMEPTIHNVFDLFLFIRCARSRLGLKMPKYFL